MIVIVKAESWELIEAPQEIEQAWKLADELTAETGIDHWVSRA